MVSDKRSQQSYNVGIRIRTLRQERGLSMRALSRASGLSPNALSMIERGRTSPTVSTVYKISHAMGLPITDIFRDQPHRSPCVLREKGASRRITIPDACLEELGGEEFEGLTEAFILTLEPGAVSGELPIIHTGNDFVYVLDGTATYQVEDKEYTLQTGDSLLFTGNLPHFFHNATDLQTRLLIVLSNFSEGEFPGEHILYSIKSTEEENHPL
ncbi:MAG: cupin domain-containing protein [Anaerolineales bacterium]|nr:cupin domain-containing protein [Anaerolineales bacterium]